MITNFGSDQIQLFRGKGDATFASAIDIPVAPAPAWLAAGDFDRDGQLDVAVSTYADSGGVVILRGDGHGGFTRSGRYATGHYLNFVTSGDLNADGAPDLIVLSYWTSEVGVLLSRGDGTFADAGFANGPSGIVSAVPIDVDGDGDLDVLVNGSGCNAVFVLKNDGRGNLALGAGYGVRDAATFLIEADLFGDGDPCVAVADGGHVSLMRPSGGRMRVVSNFDVSQSAVALSAGDLNGDGQPDLVWVDGLMGDVSVAYNTGNGRFVVESGFGVGVYPLESAVGDLDGDGRGEVVSADLYGDTFSVLARGFGGRFVARRDFDGGGAATGMVSGDFDEDGALDVALADPGSSSATVLYGAPDLFTRRTGFAVGAGPTAIAVADVNRDGHLDLVTPNQYAGTASVLIGRGDGTFEPRVDYAMGTEPYGVALGDLDGDGWPDLAVADYLGGGVSVSHNRQDGTFGPATETPTGVGPTGVAITDYDRDGVNELVVANYDVGKISFVENNLHSLWMAAEFPLGGAFAVAVAPVAATAPAELIVAQRGGASISVLRLRRNQPVEVSTIATGAHPAAVSITDLDGDGQYDLAVASAGGGSVSLFGRSAVGGFVPGAVLGTGGAPIGVAFGRFTAATIPDLCAATENGVVELFSAADSSVVVSANESQPPTSFLDPCRPNPMTNGTRIGFRLLVSAETSLRIYDVHGRLVRTVLEGPLAAGPHALEWDGSSESGRRVAPGVYLVDLTSGSRRAIARVAVLR